MMNLKEKTNILETVEANVDESTNEYDVYNYKPMSNGDKYEKLCDMLEKYLQDISDGSYDIGSVNLTLMDLAQDANMLFLK